MFELEETKGLYQAERNPAGVILCDEIPFADLVMCIHCGMPFISYKGSGAIRVYCSICDGRTCGSPECAFSKKHMCAEERLEYAEKFKQWPTL